MFSLVCYCFRIGTRQLTELSRAAPYPLASPQPIKTNRRHSHLDAVKENKVLKNMAPTSQILSLKRTRNDSESRQDDKENQPLKKLQKTENEPPIFNSHVICPPRNIIHPFSQKQKQGLIIFFQFCLFCSLIPLIQF